MSEDYASGAAALFAGLARGEPVVVSEEPQAIAGVHCWITCEVCLERTNQPLVEEDGPKEVYECLNPRCRHRTAFWVR